MIGEKRPVAYCKKGSFCLVPCIENSLTVVSKRAVCGDLDVIVIAILQEIILRQKRMSLNLVYGLR
jgi:hypothetical protein